MKRRFRSGGVTLVADEHGDHHHPPLMLMHGGGQTRHAWGDAPAKLAARGWYVINVDHRGHGESGWSEAGEYRVSDYQADVRVIAEELGQPVLVGASLGGLAGLIAEGEHPGTLRSLVLVDIAHILERAGVDRIFAFMKGAPDGFASVDEAADAVAAYLPHRRRPRNTDGLKRNLRKRSDGRFVWHWDPKLWAKRGDAVALQARYHQAAVDLDLPTLLVRGARSDVLSEEGAQAFLELNPEAEYVDLRGASHMVAGDRNDAFVEAALDFLDRL